MISWRSTIHWLIATIATYMCTSLDFPVEDLCLHLHLPPYLRRPSGFHCLCQRHLSLWKTCKDQLTLKIWRHSTVRWLTSEQTITFQDGRFLIVFYPQFNKKSFRYFLKSDKANVKILNRYVMPFLWYVSCLGPKFPFKERNGWICLMTRAAWIEKERGGGKE